MYSKGLFFINTAPARVYTAPTCFRQKYVRLYVRKYLEYVRNTFISLCHSYL